jgi:hypothetical protein
MSAKTSPLVTPGATCPSIEAPVRYSSASRPASEGGEQSVSRLWRDGFLGETTEHANGLAELLEVGAARLTVSKVRLESCPIDGRELVFEILSDEFHQLPARHLRQVLINHVVSLAAKP